MNEQAKAEETPEEKPKVDPLLVDVETACALVSVKKTKMFDLLRKGSLVRVKFGSKTLVTMASILAAIERRWA